MRQLTESYRINLNKTQLNKVRALKKYRIVTAGFIRDAIEEKYDRELPKLIERNKKSDCPF